MNFFNFFLITTGNTSFFFDKVRRCSFVLLFLIVSINRIIFINNLMIDLLCHALCNVRLLIEFWLLDL